MGTARLIGRERARRMCALATLGALVWACGDDAAAPRDAGEPDASDEPGPFGGVRSRDAGPRPAGSQDRIADCNRADPGACRAGEQCDVVIRRAPGESGFLIQTGCVQRSPERALGAPCEPWGGFALPYMEDGLAEEVYIDPCEEGLFCAPDSTIRGAYTCQRACQSGRYGEPVLSCELDQYCVPTGPTPEQSAFQEVCRAGDACEPGRGEGCAEGEGCFLRLNQAASRALTVCLPVVPEPVGDGEPCGFLNECEIGSACWGPPRVEPAEWGGDFRCRSVCTPGGDGERDAGASDDDAGAPAGQGACGGAGVCRDLAAADLGVEELGPRSGLCER